MPFVASTVEGPSAPVLREQDMKEMRRWLETQPHLPSVSDQQLVLFMHSCYYNTEATKDCIETYYTLRTKTPEFFANRDVSRPEMRSILDTLQFAMMPVRDRDGNLVILHRLRVFEPSRYVFSNSVKALFMTMESAINAGADLAPGLVVLFDMKGVRLGHLTRLSLPLLRKMFVYVQEGAPVRLKAIHVVNVMPLMDKIMALIKPFMKKELYAMLHLHSGSIEELYQYLPRSCLPSDFGGDLASSDQLHNEQVKVLEKFHDYFKEDEKNKVDESKRRKIKKNSKGLEEPDVSFQSLAID